MTTYHFVVGDWAAKPLQSAFSESDQDIIIVLKDLLNVGPLQKEEGQSFSEMRKNFWQQMLPSEKNEVELSDMEQLLNISKQMYEDENTKAVFWMAPLSADLCAYYWLLFYLSKHKGRFLLINITGLPFLNESGKLFFPKSISELSTKEVLKATKLARPISASEEEVDVYEWKQIVAQNAAIRSAAGGKKLNHHSADAYDKQLLQHCQQHFQKSHKIIQATIGKEQAIHTGDVYLAWRLRTLAAEGLLECTQEIQKAHKEPEYRLPQSGNENNNQEESTAAS